MRVIDRVFCGVCGRRSLTLDAIRNPPPPDNRRCFRCGARLRIVLGPVPADARPRKT